MLQDKVAGQLEREGIVLTGKPVVAGVSGGIDSVVLLDVLLSIGADVTVAHVNYGLRGEASDKDEDLVRNMCRDRSLHVSVFRPEGGALANDSGKSLQETARDIRYAHFERCARATGAKWIATAHNSNDQAETVLMNLMRGTGPDGLCGIPMVRSLRYDSELQIVRPLLPFSREDVEQHARMRGLQWRDDASNDELAYTRNVVRHKLVKGIETAFGPSAIRGIVRSAALVCEATASEALPSLADVVIEGGDGIGLPIEELQDRTEAAQGRLVLRLLRRYFPLAPRSRNTVRAVLDLVRRQTGRQWKHKTVCVTRERDRLLFSEVSSGTAPELPGPLEPGIPTTVPGGLIRADYLVAAPAQLDPETSLVCFVDVNRLRGPLVLDRWRQGDTIVLLGSKGAGKVSDILTDAKVAHIHRNDIRVVRSGNSIVWVVGIRASGAFAVTDQTTDVLMLTVLPTVSEFTLPFLTTGS